MSRAVWDSERSGFCFKTLRAAEVWLYGGSAITKYQMDNLPRDLMCFYLKGSNASTNMNIVSHLIRIAKLFMLIVHPLLRH